LRVSEELKMEIRTRSNEPPAKLLAALQSARLRYTQPVALYHYLALGAASADCGVFGDGENGAYEWFIWRNYPPNNVLETSDLAYGSPEIALRDVLNKLFE
jgi:hypothetical protein